MSDEPAGKTYEVKAEVGIFISSGMGASARITTYLQKLLALSQALIDQGEFSISIVVAHMACEVATDRTFADAFKTKEIEYLEESIENFLPSNNLGNDKIRKLYTALTGDEIQKQPFWPRFMETVKRRNGVSHNGKVYGKDEAEASLEVAREFVAHLNK
jgi:hypothetical protein